MTRKVIWDSAPVPRFHPQRQPVFLSDQTMKERRDKILTRMAEHQLDCLAVYCDLEHGSNFEYLTGFLTRFEDVYKRQPVSLFRRAVFQFYGTPDRTGHSDRNR